MSFKNSSLLPNLLEGDVVIFDKAKLKLLRELQKKIVDGKEVFTQLYLEIASYFLTKNTIIILADDVRDEDIIGLHITKLNLDINSSISDVGIRGLLDPYSKVNPLIHLSLRYNDKISDDGIKDMNNMRALNLIYNRVITDDGIKNMRQMQILFLSYTGR